MVVMKSDRSRSLLPFVIFGGFLLMAAFFFSTEPEAKRSAAATPNKVSVEVISLSSTDFPVVVESYGTVQPRTQSLLVSQVSGQIISIAPEFYDGQFFKRGDTLLLIDSRDTKANVRIAEASLMDAKRVLLEEEARSAQAILDWKGLGRKTKANDLVLRKPQLLAAQASLVSAEANLDKAKLELERTRITAPFDGRVFKTMVDLGQVVSPNTQLGEIYATDAVEVRLPIRNRDLKYVNLPETYANQLSSTREFPVVSLHSDLINKQEWLGVIVRTESAIDQNSRQLHVVASIEQPFAKPEEANSSDELLVVQAPIKIGQYVTAKIRGRVITSALVIPESAIYQNTFVYVVIDGTLQRRDIDIEWQNGEQAVVVAGLEPGDRLVTTPLGQVTSGTPVNVAAESL